MSYVLWAMGYERTDPLITHILILNCIGDEGRLRY